MTIRGLVLAALGLSLFGSARVDGQNPSFSYRGLYEGQLSDGAHMCLFVRSNSEAYFLRANTADSQVWFATFPISPDGSFTFQPIVGVQVSGAIGSAGASGALNSVSDGSLQFNFPRQFLDRGVTSAAGLYSGWGYRPGYPIFDCQVVISNSGTFYAKGTTSALLPPSSIFALLGTIASDGTTSCSEMFYLPANTPHYSGTLNLSDGVLTGGLSNASSSFPNSGIYFQLRNENLDNRVANISTRGMVGAGANQMIAGFIIKHGAKRVMIRSIGPSLGGPPFNVPGVLPNPKMELHSATALIASNDDWQIGNDVVAMQSTGLAPTDSRESALLVTLEEGAYTVVVSGIGGATGVALVEVYEID